MEEAGEARRFLSRPAEAEAVGRMPSAWHGIRMYYIRLPSEQGRVR